MAIKFEVGKRYIDDLNKFIIEVTGVQKGWVTFKLIEGCCYRGRNGFSPQSVMARRLRKLDSEANNEGIHR